MHTKTIKKNINKTINKTIKTKKAICEVCKTRKIKGSNATYKLKSGDTHLRQYLPKNNIPRKSTGKENVILEDLKPNTSIFYFASNTPYPDFTSKTNPFRTAYGHLENSGVSRTDANGQVRFKINCPQVYLAEDGQIYSRHIHWLYWNNKLQTWDNDIYTHQIFCNVNKNFVKKYINSQKVIIIDALPSHSYNQKHIPNAINLPSTTKWTLNQLMHILPPNTHSYTPIIIYCYNPQCTAAEKLWSQLNNLGFYNTMHYSGGLQDWWGL
jgi:rhodanese-related sulfurtransferase